MKDKEDLAIGGQALIEGVLMRSNKKISIAVRDINDNIVTKEENYVSFSNRYNFLNIPIIRGFVNIIEMMFIGVKSINYSANMHADENEKLNPVEILLSVLLGFSISIVLFIVIPAFIFTQLSAYISNILLLNLIEGLICLGIFIGFTLITLSLPYIKRTYQYHGAEHKSIHTYESGKELTVENVKGFPTVHERCGTSFIIIVMIISIFIFSFLGVTDLSHRVAYKITLMPLISGISYEFIKLNKKYKSRLFKILSIPGLLIQKITTAEPDDKQIEVAIVALKNSIRIE